MDHRLMTVVARLDRKLRLNAHAEARQRTRCRMQAVPCMFSVDARESCRVTNTLVRLQRGSTTPVYNSIDHTVRALHSHPRP